jgi:hypothetical protein
MKQRLNLADAVDDLAPDCPPCYQNRYAWREYLKSAAAAQNQRDEPRVILMTEDGAAAFNFDFPFCVDCTQVKSLEMSRLGRCQPDFLKTLGADHG